MRSDVRKLLKRIETEGLEHDSMESEHSRKFLNLEPPTAEVVGPFKGDAGTMGW